MKRLLLAATSVAVLLSGSLASAQDYNHDDHRDNRDSQQQAPRDDRQGGGYRGQDQQQRYGANGGQQGGHHWNRGDRLDGQYRTSDYRVDYQGRGWRRPPRGYDYYRTDNGDIALAAIATGVIASVIANGDRPRYDRYGRPY